MKCEDHINNVELSGHDFSKGIILSIGRALLLENKANQMANVPLIVKSGIACLMYRSCVGSLFNDILMEKKITITHSNITLIEKKLKYALEYFAEWYKCRDVRKQDRDEVRSKMWEKSVISGTTYEILFLGVLGFIGYCKYILGKYAHIHFVPVMHSNTSSIESHFSLMR